MKTRLVIVTSFITTVVVLMIVLIAFSVASPILAQSLPAQAPSLADAHLALPGGGGGGGQVWSVFGWDLEDLYSTSQHSFDLGGCRYYTSGRHQLCQCDGQYTHGCNHHLDALPVC